LISLAVTCDKPSDLQYTSFCGHLAYGCIKLWSYMYTATRDRKYFSCRSCMSSRPHIFFFYRALL